jgi:hypothetical protein
MNRLRRRRRRITTRRRRRRWRWRARRSEEERRRLRREKLALPAHHRLSHLRGPHVGVLAEPRRWGGRAGHRALRW